MRIVSLIASATEIVCRLGFEDRLVGRSHECDYPESIRSLPAVSAPKFKTDGSSRDIDDRVKQVLEEGLGVYRVSAEKLEELQPTHIVTQDHCQVCAVSFDDLQRAVCQVISSKPKIITLHPRSLDEVLEGIIAVADGLGSIEKGRTLVAELRASMAQVEKRAAKAGERPRVAHIEWLDPLMTGGNWMPALVTMAGGLNIFGEEGERSPRLAWNDIRESDPDVIMISPCGFTIERTMMEIGSLTGREGWRDLRAVRERRAFVADGHSFFNRPGPRLVESLEILAEMLHPGIFDFEHRSVNFVSLD